MQTGNKPLRIFMIEHRGTGGMIHYAYQLCTGMANQGAEVTLVTEHEYELEHLPHNFSVVRLLDLWSRKAKIQLPERASALQKIRHKFARLLQRIYRGYKLVTSWFVLVKYLLREKPNVVQFGSMEFPFEAFFLQFLKQRGLVITQICHEFEHRETSSGLIHRLDWFLQTIIYKNFDAIFFHAQNNLDRFKSLYTNTTGNLHTIPMGNESIFTTQEDIQDATDALAEKYGVSPSGPNILFFGSITPSKGLDDLITAFARVHPQNKDARLIIAGRPTKYVQMEYFLDLVEKHQLEEMVIVDDRYIPNEEIAPLLSLAAVVTFPYHNSTQSASLQVAYAFGKPVIASNVGGLPEVVVDGKSGILIPPKKPDLLAEAILKIIDDPSLGKQMWEYARELSKTKFAWDPIAKTVLVVYSDLSLTGEKL